MITINSAGFFSPAVSRGTVKAETTPEFKLPAVGEEQEPESVPEAPEPSYDVTDEQAAYYREKYGENYDQDAIHKLYYELVEQGVISLSDAAKASGKLVLIPLSAIKSITYMGTGQSCGLERYLGVDMGFLSDKVFITDICLTDKDAYKSEWDKFQEEYYREKATWQDYLRETLDFEKYLKENSPSGGSVPVQEHFDNVIAGLEKTMGVIEKIFGAEEELS